MMRSREGSIHDEGGATWAIALFHTRITIALHGRLTFTAALDVSDIKRVVRKHLLSRWRSCCSRRSFRWRSAGGSPDDVEPRSRA